MPTSSPKDRPFSTRAGGRRSPGCLSGAATRPSSPWRVRPWPCRKAPTSSSCRPTASSRSRRRCGREGVARKPPPSLGAGALRAEEKFAGGESVASRPRRCLERADALGRSVDPERSNTKPRARASGDWPLTGPKSLTGRPDRRSRTPACFGGLATKLPASRVAMIRRRSSTRP